MKRGFIETMVRDSTRLAAEAAFLRSVGSPRRRAYFATIAALLPVMAGAVGSDDKIYWANEGEGGSIRVASLGDGSGAARLGGALVGGTPCGVAIDTADGTDGRIYWADFAGDAIRVENLDGTGTVTTLISGADADGACGVAVDPVAGKIYWATYFGGEIRVANIDGSLIDDSLAKTLVSGEPGPSGVAIDPVHAKIYWTNQHGIDDNPLHGAVRRANLDGSDPVTLVPDQANPIGVALDVAAGNVYWTNLGSSIFGPGAVRRATLDGSSPETLVDAESAGGPVAVAGPAGIAIDPVDGKVYWANFGGGEIWSANLANEPSPTPLVGAGPGGSFSNFPVLLRAPAGSAAPTISGSGNVGGQLSCGSASWAPDLLGSFLFRAPHSFAFQWQLDGNDIFGASQALFTPTAPGSYTCAVTASNHAGSASQTSGALSVRPTIEVTKFYDANANGQRDATDVDVAISSWKFQVDGIGTFVTPRTLNLNPGNYVVREAAARQTNWRATTAKVVQVSLGAHDQLSGEFGVEFGNVCLGAGGALGTGFWGNKNGAALFGVDDLALMVTLNLRNATGTNFDPTSYSTFSTWLSKASSTNMALALSAQLAAMNLNVLNGKVSGSSLMYAPGSTSANSQGFATVSAVTTEANAELGLHGLTTSGSPFRSYQDSLKTALLNANANTAFVQKQPCAFTFQ